MHEATSTLSVFLMLLASVCGALGSFLYKMAIQRAGGSVSLLLADYRLWCGILSYLLVMVFFISSLRGGALSVLYPVYATTFIVSAVICLVVYGTPITLTNLAGMGFLVSGMYLMGVSR